ncbi:primosomal protein N' (replication factor Y) [Prauserella sediminis]|uniref:Probable replication restart protein PriA n=1 Tax=Prauserella sediminis TaxID=577680 RepID=A0A839XSQ1_9PSEU|nr:primosomal protein N' [Prauserella sediminis]MBB3665777.1 primosomal protein N' (replication factor Y) [Prauserella sediminis]
MSGPEPTPLWELDDLPAPKPDGAAGSGASGSAGATAGGAGRTTGKRTTGKRGGGKSSTKGRKQPADRDPIARVAVDVPLPHLDRTFDYQVPAELDARAVAGCRVRVRFAGQLVDGFVVERAATTEHRGRLAFLERVVSSEVVLTPQLAGLCRAIADRYGGTFMDVARLAIPPRHAAVEGEGSVGSGGDAGRGSPPQATDPQPADPGATDPGATDPEGGSASAAVAGPATSEAAAGPGHVTGERPDATSPGTRPPDSTPPDTTAWERYQWGSSYVSALAAGRVANAVWQALPGEDWPRRLAELAATVAAAGRGAVLVVPDHRDVTRLAAACAELAGPAAVTALSADLGPAERYRRWLAVKRGTVRIVVGTRASMFAPVTDPALYVVWDDGDDLHADPHMPYPQVRDVLMVRAHTDGASLLVGGFARTAEAQLLLESGWAQPLVAPRQQLRSRAPRVTPTGEDFDVARDQAAHAARLPAVAFEAARAALKAGAPVLVQVPRRGYVPGLACAHCRARARCRHCAGPLALPGGGEAGSPRCRWCGVTDAAFRCSACGSVRLRAVVIGSKRTAEELGRAFAGAPVRTSGGGEVLDRVVAAPAIVVATPGAEPVADGGYGAALLLDGWALLGRQDLRASEEALRRWMAAAALVRPAEAGGRVVVGAEAGIPVVQALVRWDPGWLAESELAERRELGFPPAVRMASLDASPDVLAAALDELEPPESAEILGPVPLGEVDEDGNAERERALVRVPRGDGRALAAAVHTLNAVRGARKEQEPVRIRLDPLDLI